MFYAVEQKDLYINQVESQQSSSYFCYLYIKIISTASLGFIIILVQLAILGYAIRQYRRTKQLNIMGKNVRLIYLTIFAECALFLTKLVFAELVFWLPRPHDELDKDRYQFYSTMSKYTFVVDIVGVFVIQAMLMLVCFNWQQMHRQVDKIIQIFTQLSSMQDTTEPKKQSTQKFLKFETTLKRILRFYLIARFAFFGLVIAFIAVKEQAIERILYRIMLTLLVIEVVVVPVVLGLGIAAIRRNTRLEELVGEVETGDMVRQYGILLVCTIVRFVIDIIFVVKYFSQDGNYHQCELKKQSQSSTQSLLLSILNFSVETTLTHCLPVYIVVRIFKLKEKSFDPSASLLIAQQYPINNQNPEGYKGSLLE